MISDGELLKALLTALQGVPSRTLELLEIRQDQGEPRHAGLILRSDAYCELGAPDTQSAEALFAVQDEGKNSAHLIGPDLSDLKGRSVSAALILIVRGRQLNDEISHQLNARLQRLADHPGWMVKRAGGRIWIRTSAAAGIAPTFEEASATLISRICSAFPAVESAEVWWITESSALIESLAPLFRGAAENLRSLSESVWKARGIDRQNCRLAVHCGSCADKKTCASVRAIEAQVRLRRRSSGQQAQAV